ncbi:flagellar filament capping protein FliD [Pseudaeromonas sharmana]|uniref:Flagellar hook-associated protein 2 n=1 Tax=Pseudaeromonas sharmana TaxID=328412 RepID=A0ABV8CN53_9GAMM
MSSIDPVTMAQTLVAAERANMDSLLKSQGTKIKNQIKGLDTLKTQLSTFQTLLKDLNSTAKLQAQKSTLSQDGFMTVSSNGKAISGQYSLFVRQLAQSHQLGVKFSSETDVLPSDGFLSLTVDGKEMKLDFSTLPANATVKDLVSQINNASNNPGVKASLVRSNGEVNLVLTSTSSGTAKAITANFTSGGSVASDTLAGKFAAPTEITKAQDAIVEMGGSNPLLITSSSNKLENVIDGLTINLTKAQAAGEAPLQLTVEQDNTAMTDALKKFVTGYNTLVDELNKLVKSSTDESGLLANDSTVRSLMSQLRSGIRDLPNGMTLASLGIKTDRDGKLSLDETAFTKALTADPELLSKAFSGDDGLVKRLTAITEPFTKRGGSISQRKDSLDASQRRLDSRLESHERRMQNAYNRYLAQYTQLNTVMTQMSQTSSLFG